ncbi:TetR/AcrR family transcriptional regulator [uncultured Thalassolituus sp.]|mgnify:CR=1 FL=1|uniref:TetR/AcrR family transcriptional regulator n=1 Tax=uncultured Thalassolituus sp. TaxID=285273 RepID=UPI0026069385|nr:TetR/AcrR family transcriptional regulator [uncultured Thalassolituus sp.]
MDKSEQIIEAAAELIALNGLQASPVSMVAKHACCGAGTIYRYFDTKEELVEAVYLQLMQRITRATLAGDDPSGDIRSRLSNMWLNLFRYLSDNPRDAALIDQLSVAPAICELKQRMAENELQSGVHSLFEEGRQQGLIKDLPNEVLGIYVYGGISTLVRLAHKVPGLKENTITDDMVLGLCWDAIRIHH